LPEPDQVLITRPEPGAEETAAAVAARGWQPVLAPALVLEPLTIPALPAAAALLLTSRAAARAVPPTDLPVLAVGEATAAEARARGFAAVDAAAGDAAALAALAARRIRPPGPLLLAVGAGYGEELAGALRAAGFEVLRQEVYTASPSAALPDAAAAALRNRGVAAALFFSPRSARSTVALLQAEGLAEAVRGVRALALAPRVAAALGALDWGAVACPARPDPAALLELLGERPRRQGAPPQPAC